MIKINLADRKQNQASVATASPSGAGGKDIQAYLKMIRNFHFDWPALKSALPWRKILIPLVMVYAATHADYFLRARKLAEVDAQIAQKEAVKAKFEADLAKTRGYETVKKQLDQDEAVIRAKLTAISILMEGRKDGAKMLFSLSTATPKNVWIHSLAMEKGNVTVAGKTLEFAEVSDFLRRLNESAFFRDLVLVNSEKEGSLADRELTRFEFSGKKR